VTASRRHRHDDRSVRIIFPLCPDVCHAADFKAEFIGKHPAAEYPAPECRLSVLSADFFEKTPDFSIKIRLLPLTQAGKGLNDMQTIEFEAELHNGTLQLPHPCRNWQEGKKVSVILSSQEDDMPHLTDLSRHEGVITLNEEPADFQRKMRNEWI